MSESKSGDVYDHVYAADRPELFFKAMGFRVRGSGEQVRIRRDSRWTVPEPEVVLVLNALGEAVGYTAGNDMSARDIEGKTPVLATGQGVRRSVRHRICPLPRHSRKSGDQNVHHAQGEGGVHRGNLY